MVEKTAGPSFGLRALAPRHMTPLGRVAVSVAAWTLAFVVTVALREYLQRANFAVFWIAILFTAWYAGLAAALAAAALAVVAVEFFVIGPAYEFAPLTLTNAITFAIFGAASSLVSALAASRARATRQTEAYALQLEEQAVELEAQMEEAQALAEELAQANARLEAAAADAARAREEAEAANLAKSQFLSTMSHELRTPLNAIAGYVDLLEMGVRGPLVDVQRHDLARIKRSADVLTALVNDVLSFARIEAGHVDVRMEPVRLDLALAELESLVAPQVRVKQITYDHDGCGAATYVRADPDRLRQILANLLTNAVKFTPVGGRIAVACRVEPAAVHVRVRDTGRGIPPDRLGVIFEPFVQLDRHLTHESQQGVGLGLAIGRELARAMGGDLAVTSEVGVGSTFTLVLPRARAGD